MCELVAEADEVIEAVDDLLKDYDNEILGMYFDIIVLYLSSLKDE